MRLHYLSGKALNAPRLSPSSVPSKVKAGWVWHRLTPGFGTAGGAGSYQRALVSPSGDVAFVSDRADGPDVDSGLPDLVLDYSLVKLAVPFAERGEAKAMGAVWAADFKTWACAPDRAHEFQRWIEGEPVTFDLLAPAPVDSGAALSR